MRVAKSTIPRSISGRPLKGILQKPIDRPFAPVVAALAHNVPSDIQKRIQKEVDDYVWRQRAERIVALADHYKVDLLSETALFELLLRFAEDFIVGFTSVEGCSHVGPGRKKGSTKGNLPELFIQVEILKDKGRTTYGACSILSKKRGTEWSGQSPKALRARYNRYVNSLRATGAEFREHPLYSKLQQLVTPYRKRGKLTEK
jgi:hypothetical protein